tara:strand:+ start:90 stop:296 length:207 start_codon:yes stop_codon:yes gene_type:complete
VLGILQDNQQSFFQFGATLSDAEIEVQIQLRNDARDNKDFTKADEIRDALAGQGILLDDASSKSWKKS